jgi:small-conductance mechanosensitive channel
VRRAVAQKKQSKPAVEDAGAADASADATADAAAQEAGTSDAAAPDAEAPAAVVAPPAPTPSVPASAPPVKSAAPAPSASAPLALAQATIQVGDKAVYSVRTSSGGQSAVERARSANKALKTALDSEGADNVRIERSGALHVIYAGDVPIIELTTDDARLAGDPALEVHADRVATAVREAIRTEQKRSAIATTVFSASLAVLFALIALYLLRKTSEFAARARTWVSLHRDSIPGIRVKTLEVVGPAALRSSAVLAVELAKWLMRFGIVYLWLLVTLSLFASTREYTERLTGLVVSPLSGLATRVAASLPVLVVALIAIAAIAVLLRFITLFFAGVARGETSLAWLPADLAEPTSLLLRIGIVLLALVFAAPVVTGDAEGALSRSALLALAALGLASTPIVASGLLGIRAVFGRRLRPGDFAEFGGRTGRVREVGLLEVTLDTSDGSELRVPQLLSLFHPTAIHAAAPRPSIEIAVAANPSPARTRELLLKAVQALGENAAVELIALDAGGASYRISVKSDRPDVRMDLYLAVAEALRTAKLELAARRGGAGAP